MSEPGLRSTGYSTCKIRAWNSSSFFNAHVLCLWIVCRSIQDQLGRCGENVMLQMLLLHVCLGFASFNQTILQIANFLIT